MEGVGFGGEFVVFAGGGATTKVCGQPSDSVVWHCCVVYVCEEACVVDCVEGFGEVHCHRHSAVYGVVLVETCSYLVDQRKECGGGGSPPAETMLAV